MDYITANYYPPGNVTNSGQFERNVLKSAKPSVHINSANFSSPTNNLNKDNNWEPINPQTQHHHQHRQHHQHFLSPNNLFERLERSRSRSKTPQAKNITVEWETKEWRNGQLVKN